MRRRIAIFMLMVLAATCFGANITLKAPGIISVSGHIFGAVTSAPPAGLGEPYDSAWRWAKHADNTATRWVGTAPSGYQATDLINDTSTGPTINGTTSYYFNGAHIMTNKYATFLSTDAVPVTVSIWFKSPTAQSSKYLLSRMLSDYTTPYSLYLNGGSIVDYFAYPPNLYVSLGTTTSTVHNNANWHLAAFSIDGAMRQYFYDGRSVASNAWAHPLVTNATVFAIGAAVYNGTAQLFSTNTTIADINYHRRVVTEAEHGLMYTNGANYGL